MDLQKIKRNASVTILVALIGAGSGALSSWLSYFNKSVELEKQYQAKNNEIDKLYESKIQQIKATYENRNRELDLKMVDVALSILRGEKGETPEKQSIYARRFALRALRQSSGVEFSDQELEKWANTKENLQLTPIDNIGSIPPPSILKLFQLVASDMIDKKKKIKLETTIKKYLKMGYDEQSIREAIDVIRAVDRSVIIER